MHCTDRSTQSLHKSLLYWPANILLPSLSKVGPESVSLLFFGVQGPECVDETFFQELAEALSFLGSKACISFVAFRVLQICKWM